MSGHAGGGTQRPAYAVDRPPADSVRRVQLSCQLLARNQGEFIESFYEAMAGLVPQMRELAPQAGRPVCNRLAQSVLWAAMTQDAPDTVEATLRRVGGGIQQQGFDESWYRSFGAALLETVRRIHKGDWGSRLSSDWIAFYTWLSAHLRLGADAARRQPDHRRPWPDHGQWHPHRDARQDDGFAPAAGQGTVTDWPPGEPLSVILALLRTRYFPDDERGLAVICTRVALRLGVDLRAPRPDQQKDPAVVSRVLDVLLVLGFSLLPSPHDLLPRPPHPEDSGAQPADGEQVAVAGFRQFFRRFLTKADR
ncbi:hypothetical protein [Streptomyces thermoalcalitolerans]|uniref:Globin n=1 Tax=Streptomyces thermoalcalitolerans TaxID=65605 RepID=A0ABN1NF51_9ACTN